MTIIFLASFDSSSPLAISTPALPESCRSENTPPMRSQSHRELANSRSLNYANTFGVALTNTVDEQASEPDKFAINDTG